MTVCPLAVILSITLLLDGKIVLTISVSAMMVNATNSKTMAHVPVTYYAPGGLQV